MLKCDICDGRLVMDDSRRFATCEFCGTKYLTSTLRDKMQGIQSVNATENNYTKATDFVIRGGVLEKYNGEAVDVLIPDKVLVIGEECFSQLQIHSVSMPDSVEEIRLAAFDGCSALRKIKMSNNLRKIESFAFQNCTNLEQVELPESLEQWEVGVFEGCRNLKKINIPSKIKWINSVFQHCESLEEIVIPNSIIEIATSDCFPFRDCFNLKKVIFMAADSSHRNLELDISSYAALESQITNNALFRSGMRKTKNDIWKEHGTCQYCGGSFDGLLIKKCSRCGRTKDY